VDVNHDDRGQLRALIPVSSSSGAGQVDLVHSPDGPDTILAMSEPPDLLATRAAYDAVAVDYEELLRDQLTAKPYDRAILAAFAERVLRSGNRAVADVGCGPGRITEHLDSLGLDAFGIDLSPGMIEVARKSHPDLNFDVGSIEALDMDAAFGGIVAWYSIIHTPPERLPAVFQGFHRALVPRGFVVLAFQAGDGPRHVAHAYGHDIALDAFLLSPDQIAMLLHDGGFEVEARLTRAPDEDERTPQAYLIARKR
jgi:SAM-dependent methyltransferase